MAPVARTTLAWTSAVVLLLVAVGGAGLFLVRPRSLAKGPVNVVLISIDTCRADRLSCYGFPRTTTPNIDAVARDGVLFENAITPVPITLPAHCSLLTGMNPPHHGVHSNIAYHLDASNVTLAEMLAERGYATGAVVGSYVLDEQFHMDQGFQFYDATFKVHPASSKFLSDRAGDEVNRVATAWLEKHADERFFLFLHYYDPHFPYAPPEPFKSRFADDAYAGEIAFTDYCVGEIMDTLKRLGLYDSSLIIVTSDHGEALGQHGERTHGYFIYHATTKVPLILKPPGRTNAKRIDEKVGLIDVFPTVLEYAGITPDPEVHGISLLPHVVSGPPRASPRFIFSESLMAAGSGCSSLLALENEEWKYIQSSKPELYNLREDPGELTNVVKQHSLVALDLRNRLKAMLEGQTRVSAGDAALAMDSDSIKRLESLGYVAGGAPEAIEFDTDKEAPVDFLPFFRSIAQANELLHRDPNTPLRIPTPDGGTQLVTKYEVAKLICAKVLAARPDNFKAHSILARLARDQGNLVAAHEHLSAMVRANPRSASAHHDLGHVLKGLGKLDEAVSSYRKARDLADDRSTIGSDMEGVLRQLGAVSAVAAESRLSLASALFAQGKVEEAADVYREVIQFKPRHAKAHYVMGLAASGQGRREDAIRSFRRALEANPKHAAASRALESILEPATGAVQP